jgi:hypothetical protein
VQSVTPAYQKQFLPKNHSAKGVKLKFTYGCIGPMLNPDEINFISWLAEISNEIDSTITILQHPKFAHNLIDFNSGKLLFKTFDYLSSTLQDYYAFIAEQNFVIASGTSFALDALLVRTPLIGLAFEIIEQEYWLSHLRGYDTIPHSKFLFEKMPIKKVYSKLELIELLKGNCAWQNLLNSEDSNSSVDMMPLGVGYGTCRGPSKEDNDIESTENMLLLKAVRFFCNFSWINSITFVFLLISFNNFTSVLDCVFS